MLFHIAGRWHRTKCGQARASRDQGQVASNATKMPSRQPAFIGLPAFLGLPAFSFAKGVRKTGMAACGKL
jgi:hypothetical protein